MNTFCKKNGFKVNFKINVKNETANFQKNWTAIPDGWFINKNTAELYGFVNNKRKSI